MKATQACTIPRAPQVTKELPSPHVSPNSRGPFKKGMVSINKEDQSKMLHMVLGETTNDKHWHCMVSQDSKVKDKHVVAGDAGTAPVI